MVEIVKNIRKGYLLPSEIFRLTTVVMIFEPIYLNITRLPGVRSSLGAPYKFWVAPLILKVELKM